MFNSCDMKCFECKFKDCINNNASSKEEREMLKASGLVYERKSPTKIANIIIECDIPCFKEEYLLKTPKYGYKLDIFHEDLCFIPETLKKKLKLSTPFSDKQRISMEKFLLNYWRKKGMI